MGVGFAYGFEFLEGSEGKQVGFEREDAVAAPSGIGEKLDEFAFLRGARGVAVGEALEARGVGGGVFAGEDDLGREAAVLEGVAGGGGLTGLGDGAGGFEGVEPVGRGAGGG